MFPRHYFNESFLLISGNLPAQKSPPLISAYINRYKVQYYKTISIASIP